MVIVEGREEHGRGREKSTQARGCNVFDPSRKFGMLTPARQTTFPQPPLPSYYPVPPSRFFSSPRGPSFMTRKRKSPLQLRIGRPRCPCCGKRFTDILRHLNHKRSKCAGWFNNGSSLESPPPSSLPQHPSDDHGSEDLMADDSEFVQDFPGSTVDRGSTASSNSCSRQRVEFPGAGVTHGRTASFMDRFNEDRHSGSRVENAHYPFAGKDEWELASFLHSSGLLM